MVECGSKASLRRETGFELEIPDFGCSQQLAVNPTLSCNFEHCFNLRVRSWGQLVMAEIKHKSNTI